MKTCKKCGLQKDVSEFPREKRNKDGLSGKCRTCTNATAAAWSRDNIDKRREYYENNRARLLADKADYYQRNSDLIKKKAAAHRLAGADRLREYFREYSAKHSEKIVERVRVWRSMNPGKKIVHNQNRRAKKKLNGGKLSADIVERLMKLQRGQCAACRTRLLDSGFHLDHIESLSAGGENSDANVQLLCPLCNTQKHTAHPVDFMQRKGYLL